MCSYLYHLLATCLCVCIVKVFCSPCNIRVVSKGWYDVGSTYVTIATSNGTVLGGSNGVNIYTVDSKTCVAKWMQISDDLNFYIDSTRASTRTINILSSIAQDTIVIVAVQDTGPYMYSSSNNPSLYAALRNLGATVSSFQVRSSYVLISLSLIHISEPTRPY